MRRTLLAICSLLVVACRPGYTMDMSINTHVERASTAAVAADTVADLTPPRRGALYRVRHDGKTSYLFGTVHVGKQAFYPLEPQVTQALNESTSLVLELDIRADAAFQQALARYARYAPGDSVRNHVSAETLAQLDTALNKAGMSLAGMEHFKPWLLANVLVGAEIERQGYRRSNGVEQYLLSTAVQQRKPLRELESADYQLSLFDTLDDAQQEAYLRENLAELASGVSLTKTANLLDAWSRADARGIWASWKTLTSGETVSAAFMERTLLGKRNPEMAASIEAIMRQDQVAFVGVGLLHLVGDHSVPQLLRERGYQVEQLY